MNITTVATINPLNRIKMKYVVMAGALALAIAAIAIPGHSTRPAMQPQTTNDNWTTVQSKIPNHNSYIYYLVASEAQRDALVAKEESPEPAQPRTYYLVTQSFNDEYSVYNTQRELTELGHTVQIIDLRNDGLASTPLPFEAAKGRSTSQSDLDARIMAGVISSEHGTYMFDAGPKPNRPVSELDVRSDLAPQQVRYVLVASEAEKSGLENSLTTDAYDSRTRTQTTVMVVMTPVEEARLQDAENEMTLVGTPFQTIDLRASSVPLVHDRSDYGISG